MTEADSEPGSRGGRPADAPPCATPYLVAVLDMGASAIRLGIAQHASGERPRIMEEASKGVLLGRDTFSLGAIRSQTIDAAIAALGGFLEITKEYGVQQVHAVATSAVREARNGEMFLDRIQARTGVAFDIINEAEESRLIFLAVRDELSRDTAFRGARALLAEVGGGSTSLTLLRRGEPSHSGVYALGAVRLRQQLDLARHSTDIQLALLRRYVSNVVEEIRLEIPLNRITHFIAVGGDVRFAASQIIETAEHAAHKASVLHAIRSMFRDNVKARVLGPDGVYTRVSRPAGEVEYRVQVVLLEEAQRRAAQAIDRAGVTLRPARRHPSG